jgi:hypothetical protein
LSQSAVNSASICPISTVRSSRMVCISASVIEKLLRFSFNAHATNL